MFQLDTLGRWLIVVGLSIAALGLFLFLIGKVPGLGRLGSLPGDIRYQSPDGRLTCFVPIASSILLSLILTVILNLIVRVLNR
ncbi:MAG TPA: DUF2905 domain-containing protein [Chloroflexi bacterium]|nr:DUF2905 domain-containing protein [Chloroflexota bacterium]